MCDQVSPAQLPRRCGSLGLTRPPRCGTKRGSVGCGRDGRGSWFARLSVAARVRLFATAPEQAVSAWQVIESVALALGGSGGQLAGGVWVLLVSAAARRAKEFPAAMNWLGAGIGTAGILSTLPALSMLEVAYELLMIVWFGWLGIAMLRSSGHSQPGPCYYSTDYLSMGS